MSKPIIAVIGVTGQQGGAVAKALVKNGKYAVRGITRDPSSEKAKNTSTQLGGCEMVKADMDDEAALTNAFTGCYGAFLVSDYWGNAMDAEKEFQAIKNMGNAAKAAKLEHVVFSFLEDTRKFFPADTTCPTLHGKYKVPHFDMKGEGKAWMETLGIPATYVGTCSYYSNFVGFGMGPKRYGKDQPLTITFPMGNAKLALNDTDDIGIFVANILEDKSAIGKTLGLSSEVTTCQAMADTFSEVLGEKVVYNAVSFEQYAALGFPGAGDLANMFQFVHDFQDHWLKTRADPDVLARYLPSPKPFKTWVIEHKDELKPQ